MFDGTGNVFWQKSCSNNAGNCNSRNNRNLSDRYIGPYNLQNSDVGRNYRTYSECQSGCGISDSILATGYQSFN